MPNVIQPPFLHSSIVVGTSAFTVTVKLHDAGFPTRSIAVAVTVVVPTVKVLPEAGRRSRRRA